ncbi:Hypothetical predicted protein [Pelobates cultripes]|uniref:Uncharacterized protein n=1 Tax=Pelobates cultripes TaxID=61616 RepID=A0AAD1SMB9_PELCU|nr:Hypothetical predicted protein [Pelobates cultripes]
MFTEDDVSQIIDPTPQLHRGSGVLPSRSMETITTLLIASDSVWEILQDIQKDLREFRNEVRSEFATMKQSVAMLECRADTTDDILTNHAVEIEDLQKIFTGY